MKRRENLRSSSTSSHRETTPESHLTKNIGCISGIFQLVSKYQNRRKLLTLASKQEKIVTSKSPSKPKPSSSVVLNTSQQSVEKSPFQDSDFKRFSCDELRSPTIPSKIRLSNSKSSDNSPRSLQRSPALVARLMGLDEIPLASDPSPVSSSVEKRRKLMEALEKCDEDLKVLKNIIETIRSTDSKVDSCSGVVVKTRSRLEMMKKCEVMAPKVNYRASNSLMIRNQKWMFDDVDGGDSMKKDKKCSDFNHCDDQPSPVSVLDQISSDSPSPSPSNCHHQIGDKYKKLREESANNLTYFKRITFEALPRINSERRGSSSISDIDHQYEYWRSSAAVNINNQTSSSSSSAAAFEFQSNKSKVESVNEVCMDAMWAERWELGRIGVVLEDYIFQVLIEEIIRELGFCGNYISSSSVPFEKCRKRLSF